MATYDDLLALDNKLKTHQRAFAVLKLAHLKINLTIFTAKFKRKHSQIWYKLFKFQRFVLLNNLPIQLKKFKLLQEYKLLLKNSRNLPCTCSA